MRSQASKSSPKKGELSKTSPKSKPIKKKVVPSKKGKQLEAKSVAKNSKKNTKDDSGNKNEGESTGGDKTEPQVDSAKATTSKSNDSPTKKTKKDPKEKKDPVKTPAEANVKKVTAKKPVKINKPKPSAKPSGKQNDAKYKNKKNVVKKPPAKFTKAKTIVRKGKATTTPQKKKIPAQSKSTAPEKEKSDVHTKPSNEEIKEEDDTKKTDEQKEDGYVSDKNDNTKSSETSASKIDSNPNSNSTSPKPPSQPETPKSDTERPPKFFTSTRSPRTVDIDVKCCKNSKGNLSVSERFLSMKCETKSEDNKDKSAANTLISQGPDIDVYTFTEKVDSPKSILSDFRNPINKTIGRVRPIARVKGTIIDKKTDSEKKKYSPHRPIEEVVKQLKANKRSEELNTAQSNETTTLDLNKSAVKESDTTPKPIVSKSYKMVARKSSVTGKPFSPIKFLDQELPQTNNEKPTSKPSPTPKKQQNKPKKVSKSSSSDDEIDTSKFALNTNAFHYSSSEESVNESNDDTKESSESDASKNKKAKNKKYKKFADSAKKSTSKELKELSKDSLLDLKDESLVLGDKPSKRRRKLLSMWNGPKKHRMASLNAIAKVHCLYENESRTHMELGLMKTVDRQAIPGTSKQAPASKKKEVKPKEVEKQETTSESEYEAKKEKKDESSESSDDNRPQRTLRGVPGIRSAGKYWDPKSSTSSSEDSELETKKKITPEKKKAPKSSSGKSDSDKPPPKMKKTAGVPVKKKRNRNEVVMDLKDMVVQKRMASLNATAILAASYEKRSPKSNKDDTTSDSCSDESFSQKSKNGVSSGVKSESKINEPKKEKECEETAVTDTKQKVEVIVNQDTDVTITGVYSTHHHEGFCTVSGMQYRISSTSHTQTTATSNCEKEGCLREDGARYTPLSALSSMQPPAEHGQTHPHPGYFQHLERLPSHHSGNSNVFSSPATTRGAIPSKRREIKMPELGGLSRRAGCSSAFSAPSPSAHHEPGKPSPPCGVCDDVTRLSYGYYQPAGPLIKESSNDDRALARYHPPHYHAPHPPVLQQYPPPPYYQDLCYGRYYRTPGPYHMPPPQPDAPMGGLGNEPYPPPQYYGTPSCYQHPPQRIPYVEYRGCPCPLNACPKNVLIGPATGKAPAGGGPDVPSALVPPGGAFRAKVRACALDAVADTHGSGKDPPLEPEPPAATDAPHPCPLPAIGGASPKRELFDVRDNLRLASERGPSEAGPPSPARGSAGACAPQPPTAAPRRARLGKAMARRSLAGDDTGLLLSGPQPALAHHSDADDDVLAISPPICVPIDLSSSDERSTPLVDIKKENEGPTFATARKPEAQALKEHNSTTMASDATIDTSKAVKRRYSRPNLEIDMKDTQLEEGCKTNGIGEHVKLVKRRKVSGDQPESARVETISKEPKKRSSQPKKTPKSPKSQATEKKPVKRKLENTSSGPRAKKVLVESACAENPRVGDAIPVINGIPAIKDIEDLSQKPKNKSALLLDNLIRKNSIDRADSKGYSSDKEISPAELFLPSENIAQNCTKKMLNINNNIVDNTNTNGVRPKTIAAVSQLIGKKLASKNACKLEKVDSKVTHTQKSVLKPPTVKPVLPDRTAINDCALTEDKEIENIFEVQEVPKPAINGSEEKTDATKDNPIEVCTDSTIAQDTLQSNKVIAKPKLLDVPANPEPTESQKTEQDVENDRTKEAEKRLTEGAKAKRCKLTNGEMKAKNVEKVVKLLVSKRPAIKTDEATLVVEEACAAGAGAAARRRGRGRARRRAPAAPPALEPRAPPRWSNGWNWDGEHYLSKVYLNNDSRLDRVARCWPRMAHASGDRVARGDCVLLRASVARAQPFVARVASLWENPEDGEMMVSLVWYYRPEHTERGRAPADAPDEVFASRHRDANSVACIEDKCYVLTFNEYCRYRKRLKAAEEGVTITPTIVPPLPAGEVNPLFAPNDSKLPPAVSPELVLFCRKIYDFRSKKIHVPNK